MKRTLSLSRREGGDGLLEASGNFESGFFSSTAATSRRRTGFAAAATSPHHNEPPVPPLESLDRTAGLINHLKDLTAKLSGISQRHNGPIAARSSVRGVGGNPDEEPIIPVDREAYLALLARGAMPDDEVTQTLQRIEDRRPTSSLFLNESVVPPRTSEARNFIAAKTDTFQSNEGQFKKLVALTPRSLARQKSDTLARMQTEAETEEDPTASEKATVQSLASDVKEKSLNDLLESSVVLQAAKGDLVGNFTMKRTVQLAMAAQHAHQLEEMKKLFEQRLHEAVGIAKHEGYLLGQEEGAAASVARISALEKDNEEMRASLDRLQGMAAASFKCKQTLEGHIQHLLEEKSVLESKCRRLEEVNLDELVAQKETLLQEREYLYKQAFRTLPDMLASSSPATKRGVSPPNGSNPASSPPAAASPSHQLQKSAKQRRSFALPGHNSTRDAAGGNPFKSVQAVRQLHERLSNQIMSLLDDPVYLTAGMENRRASSPARRNR